MRLDSLQSLLGLALIVISGCIGNISKNPTDPFNPFTISAISFAVMWFVCGIIVGSEKKRG